MSDDQMAEFEAQFGAAVPVASTKPCRACKIRPAHAAGCQSCWSVDGDCCYCQECGRKRLGRLVPGAIAIHRGAKATGVQPTIHGATWCDLARLADAFTGLTDEELAALLGALGFKGQA